MHNTECLQTPVAALQAGRSGVFGPIQCYLVSIWSEHASPWKYTYEGCKQCLTSRRKGISCHREASTIDIYRFTVFLTDGSRHGEPLKVTIFNEAAYLLEMSAGEFRKLPVDIQEEIVRRTILSFPRILVWITIKQGSLIVSGLQRGECSVQSQSTIVREPEGSSKSEKRVSYEEFDDMRKCLADIYEKLQVPRTGTEGPGSSTSGFQFSSRLNRNPEDPESSSSAINLTRLSRKELQSLCKEYKLPANKKNGEMAEALKEKLKSKGGSF